MYGYFQILRRGEFILTLQAGKNGRPEITVLDIHAGCFTRQRGLTIVNTVLEKTFPPGEYFVNVNCGNATGQIK
jgi:hypothetical protein